MAKRTNPSTGQMKMKGRHVVVIGGGVGGLAAAIRLARVGFGVTLLEKNARVGGKLNLWEIRHPLRPSERPFRFDTGPSLLTLPFVFEQLFAAAGEKISDHLDLIRLNPIARFCWADGFQFELKATLLETQAELNRIAPDQATGWTALAERGQEIWNRTADLFLYHSPEQALSADRFDPRKALSMLTVPLQIGMLSRFNKLIDRHLSSPRLREVVYQYATYSGASPFRAPATLAVIPHAEQHFGGWYPRGGMYRIAEALEAIARRLGVVIRTDAPVQSVIVENTTARGVILADGNAILADAVIANSDLVYTYRNLIERKNRRTYTDFKLDRLEAGGSGMVLLLGIEGTYPQLAHHTKFMPDDYTTDLTAMFETKTIPTDPCIYVCASTRTDSTQAPDGCENLFVLASAPAIDGKLDWSTQGPRYRDQLVSTLEHRWRLKDLSKRIVVERHLTPADLQSTYNANAGSIYGIGSNSRRSAFLRPPNRDRDIRHLYFAGGGTHPGGGLPLVALSGKIVSELLMADFGLEPLPPDTAMQS
jgi:phytoene desaturase